MDEPLARQVDRLATFIMTEVPLEPSQSEGAIDTAIRIIRTQHEMLRDLALVMGEMPSEVKVTLAEALVVGPHDVLVVRVNPQTTTVHGAGAIANALVKRLDAHCVVLYGDVELTKVTTGERRGEIEGVRG